MFISVVPAPAVKERDGCYVVYSIGTTDGELVMGEERTPPGYSRQGREGNNALWNDWGKRSE